MTVPPGGLRIASSSANGQVPVALAIHGQETVVENVADGTLHAVAFAGCHWRCPDDLPRAGSLREMQRGRQRADEHPGAIHFHWEFLVGGHAEIRRPQRQRLDICRDDHQRRRACGLRSRRRRSGASPRLRGRLTIVESHGERRLAIVPRQPVNRHAVGPVVLQRGGEELDFGRAAFDRQ